MQLSALLTLLPLAAAAALPQSRGSVEARYVEGECDLQFDKCCNIPSNLGNEMRNALAVHCPLQCYESLKECNNKSATEKRFVEEAPLEARYVEDECDLQYDECCHIPSNLGNEMRNALAVHCPLQCYESLKQCKAKPAEKRSVEKAPRYVEDECDLQYDDCCHIPSNLGNEMRNALAVHCPLQCYNSLKECKATQAEKRSAIQARDNGSEATTACYGQVASCKHKGTPVVECYNTLARCIQDVYQKFHG